MMFEFEDSEVAQIQRHGEALQIRFSAARLVEGGKNGAGEGLWQPMLLICKHVALDGAGFEAVLASIGRLRYGQLEIQGQRLRSLPSTFESEAAYALELDFANGSRCLLQGRGLRLQLTSQQCSVQSFQCG
ncbi:MAG: hypothetical protein RR473_01185 [Comamonas sp.]